MSGDRIIEVAIVNKPSQQHPVSFIALTLMIECEEEHLTLMFQFPASDFVKIKVINSRM